MPLFQLDPHDEAPLYQQLIDQVKRAVADGRLRPGDRLPAIRDLAAELRLNRNTVARVYSLLETQGLLFTRTGQGCFVSDRGSRLAEEERLRQVREAFARDIAQARLYGFDRPGILAIVEEQLTCIFDAAPPAAAS